MRLQEFDYDLPAELIAQEPLADRAASRMLVVDRQKKTWEDGRFRDLPGYLGSGDCLVLNDSRVFASRLYGCRRSGRGGRVEMLLTKAMAPDGLTWEALVRPGRKMRTGEWIDISPELEAEILGRGEFGERAVRLHAKGDVFDVLERSGHVPLPPYIRRRDTEADRERYQTVYARERGSAAAPTAGLHFTAEVLEQCKASGAEIARVTLHVGLGTFQPLRAQELERAHLHSEWFRVPAETVRAMDRARRVVAVGTTSVRAIESDPSKTETDLFIYPGFRFRRTGALLTNFHLPQSSLLVLACAFAGTELMLAAYRHAVEARYRFFSYGDCMLIV
ncbi:MAG TPA: tRNA preQ1(34) S-adenosylmethionine ribosyltransferase-isomerase QueA [Bryobacteraceae bacterium]|nr:tRNA preQ1(34) S-adenosylmethionine ribosyltransferase-isomerase QueA [Bryobacteraceae bacterium]